MFAVITGISFMEWNYILNVIIPYNNQFNYCFYIFAAAIKS